MRKRQNDRFKLAKKLFNNLEESIKLIKKLNPKKEDDDYEDLYSAMSHIGAALDCVLQVEIINFDY